ncbi:hypothetical protein [Cohnella nanjingensis]|nr:hypothetical protein [Cohnella nanjingensis]
MHMLDAEQQKRENQRSFEEVKRQYFMDLRTRFGMTDLQLIQSECLVNWAYEVGFNNGGTYARQTEFNARMQPASRQPSDAATT